MNKKEVVRRVGAVYRLIDVPHDGWDVINSKILRSTVIDCPYIDMCASPENIIVAMTDIIDRYHDKYTDMYFRSEMSCGCPCDCSCSEEHNLYGTRLETDIECTFREALEKKKADEAKALEIAQFEKLRLKYGDK
jgi:hypothetical protein